MCGICGILFHSGSSGRTPERRVLENMVSTLRHRGPDGSGVYIDGPIGFGATRLSIIDLSSAADQPMVLNNGDYVISFNGEIYNYVELREELENEGVRCASASDTEVLLRLYIQRGIKCLDALRGMFAFAIWDRKNRSLFLARDRVGEKPLVYYCRDGIFAFASEIKSLLTIPDVPRVINPIGLHYGLHYVTVPAPHSAFRHIHKLRPAEYMLVSPKGIFQERYWRPKFDETRRITDIREAAYEVNRCLQETVGLMCRSDVPVGATLSGGLDTSGVVAMMSPVRKSFETFCVSYHDPSQDSEFTAARLVAQKYRTQHHELFFNSDQLAAADTAVRSFDEPFGMFVPLHAMVLSRLIGDHVKVALTGNGGDELFGGYADHRMLYDLEKASHFWKRWERGVLPWCAEHGPLTAFRKSWERYRRLQAVPVKRLAAEMRLNSASAFCSEVYSDRMKTEVGAVDVYNLFTEAFDEYGADSLFDGFLYQQLMVSSQHSIVDIPDRTGMANSLEFRSPFLDKNMIELAMRIAPSLKVAPKRGDKGGKIVLRKALTNHLPREIVSMKKSGFGSQIPYRKFMQDDWSEYVAQKLTSRKITESGLFNTPVLAVLYEYARRGRPVPFEMLWGVVMISQWLEEYF